MFTGFHYLNKRTRMKVLDHITEIKHKK
uniref:Uncharacterized protein n=1 Tax=Rhizophora mucronata TaxID=61149 RepID=A0A2P2QAX1_RHIMU